MTREYESKELLQQKIIRGANVLADNVASTLGPKGRNVLLQEAGKAPFITFPTFYFLYSATFQLLFSLCDFFVAPQYTPNFSYEK